MRRDNAFQFRVSTPEKEQIERNAEDAGCSPSAYVRARALGGNEKPSIPDAATTVPPSDPLPARTQEERDQEAPAQAEDFKRLVAMHYKKTSLPNAERLAKKELGYEGR